MDIKKSISMEPVKEKLRNLQKYMPEQQELVYEFGNYLADMLNPELVPFGFNMAAELALYDIQAGVNSFTKEPISTRLAGYPPQIYALLRNEIPDIAEAVCPEDFAKDVREVFEDIRDSVI